MSNKSILKEKSYSFAIRIIKLYKYLKSEKNETILSKQIVRSGTSIGANIEEAIGAQSKNDFMAKISIAYKESRETEYWLRLLKDRITWSVSDKREILHTSLEFKLNNSNAYDVVKS